MNSGSPPRRNQGYRPTDDELLDGVVGVLATSGFGAVTVAELAAGAGTTMQTLYAHFGSKDALLERVLEREFVAFVDGLKDVAEANPPQQGVYAGVKALVEAVFAFAAERPHGMKVLSDPTAPGALDRHRRLREDAVSYGLGALASAVDGFDEHDLRVAAIVVPAVGATIDAATAAALRDGIDPALTADVIARFVAAGTAAAWPLFADAGGLPDAQGRSAGAAASRRGK